MLGNLPGLGVPPALVDEIRSGNCVAFVGAGFSAAGGLPSWRALLACLAREKGVAPDLRDHVADLVGDSGATAHALDQAAQMLADHFGAGGLVSLLRSLLLVDALPDRMQRRLLLLRSIPFRAILTTNFDGILGRGATPEPSSYRRILRHERSRWWQQAFWDPERVGAPVLHLHGDLRALEGAKEIVFTRADYRRRLYSDPAYVTFLRSIFSTATVLYLGFSFMDAYLNELRSEILALLGYTGREMPIAYAVVNDVGAATRNHFRRHEGIDILSYDSTNPPDFHGFDAWLEAIYRATSTSSQLGALLSGKRILWMDPKRDNNDYGVAFLERAAAAHDDVLKPIETVETPAEALAALAAAESAGHPFDLVISHWGRTSLPANVTPGAQLLIGMRARDLRCPVLVFAGMHEADQRKSEALSLGAQAYCFQFETLFRRIEEIFSPASSTW